MAAVGAYQSYVTYRPFLGSATPSALRCEGCVSEPLIKIRSPSCKCHRHGIRGVRHRHWRASHSGVSVEAEVSNVLYGAAEKAALRNYLTHGMPPAAVVG